MEWYIWMTVLLTCALCDNFNLPAYEYLRRFKQPLNLGQCANRVVQYPDGPIPENCNFPTRQGETITRRKEVETQMVYPIHNASELIRQIGLCDDRAAAYFGLLAGKNECIVNEIASQLSFKKKSATLMYMYHYRPRVDVLIPSTQLNDVPKEYTHYLNDTYYTINISIGTEEVIIVELQYRSRREVEKVYADTSHNSKLSRKLTSIAKKAGLPRRVKIITLSTSDYSFKTEVFKGEPNALFEASERIQQYENDIARSHQEILHSHKTSHLTYGFKAYEIGPVPYALPFTSMDSDRKQRWEEAALLQVKAERMFEGHRRYKKLCRKLKTKHKACRPLVELLQKMQDKVISIHDSRRDWVKLSKMEQFKFIRQELIDLKLLKSQAKPLVRALRSFKNKK